MRALSFGKEREAGRETFKAATYLHLDIVVLTLLPPPPLLFKVHATPVQQLPEDLHFVDGAYASQWMTLGATVT